MTRPLISASSPSLIALYHDFIKPLFENNFAFRNNVERSSSVGIVTGYKLHGWGSIPGRDKIFFSTAYIPALWLTHPPVQWTSVAIAPKIKRPAREADNSFPSNA
jgi:hypothetical protein